MIANVRSDAEGGVIIGRLQGGEHFKEVLQAGRLAGNDALGAFQPRVFAQQFRHVVRDVPVIQPGPAQDVPHQNVEVEVRGDPQTPALFEQGAKERLVIKNQIAGFRVRQKCHQRRRVAFGASQDRLDEFNVIRGKLDSAIGLNHSHKSSGSNFDSTFHAQPNNLTSAQRPFNLKGQGFAGACPSRSWV